MSWQGGRKDHLLKHGGGAVRNIEVHHVEVVLQRQVLLIEDVQVQPLRVRLGPSLHVPPATPEAALPDRALMGCPFSPMKPRRTRWEAPAAITTSHWASLLLSLCTQSHPTPAGLQRAGQKQSVRNCLSIVFRAISRWKSCLRSAAKASGTSGILQTGSDERQVCAPGPPCQACEGNLAQA